jgi:chromosome segregation ATPase
LFLLLLLALAVGFVATSPADGAYRRRRSRGPSAMVRAMRQSMINAANQQLAAARTVLAIAETKGANAQTRLGSATTKLQQAADEFRSAHTQVHTLTVQLHEIENELLDQQPEGSPLSQAEDRVDQAKVDLDKIANHLYESPAFKAQLADMKGAEMYARRAELLSLDPQYSLFRTQLQLAADELDRIRRDLLQSDSGWKSAAESLVEARKEEAKADASSASSGASRLRPLGDLRNASKAAATARMLIAQSEAVLRSLKATPKGSSSSYSSSQAKKK